MPQFEEITARLRGEEQELQSELSDLQEQRKSISKSLNQVQSALRALTGTKYRKSNTQKSVTNRHVSKWVENLLQTNGSQTAEILQKTIEAHAKKEGFSLSGMALRLQQTLKSERFLFAEGCWHLATSASKLGNRKKKNEHGTTST